MEGGVHVELRDGEQVQEGLKLGGLLRVDGQVFLHTGPQLRCNDDGDAAFRRRREFAEACLVAQDGDARARIEHIGGRGGHGSEFQDGTLVSGGAGWWLWEILCVREILREVAGDLGEGFELGVGDGAEHHFIPMFLDQHFRTGEPEGLGQPHGLAAAMLEDFGCGHSYVLYLYVKRPHAASASFRSSSSFGNGSPKS